MATHALIKYKLAVFWDTQYKQLNYINEQFNDVSAVSQWLNQGYSNRFTGAMCDMRSSQPTWNKKFIEHFQAQGWQDIGTSYYCMQTGTVLPLHSDLYTKYIDLFQLRGREQNIRRAIVMLEDWQSGHYLEIMNQAISHWSAGQVIEWTYDTPHMAANIGLANRYTLQITGHVKD